MNEIIVCVALMIIIGIGASMVFDAGWRAGIKAFRRANAI